MNHPIYGAATPQYLNGTANTAAANTILAAPAADMEYIITDLTLTANEAQINAVQLGNDAGAIFVNIELHAAGALYNEHKEPYPVGNGKAIVLTLNQAKQVRYHMRYYLQPAI